MTKICPKCNSKIVIKSGIVKDRQRFRCKKCNYNFTVEKLGKAISSYYVTKALQLYLEGLSYREIERIIGISHVSVSNWVKAYKIKRPYSPDYHPTYKILNHQELQLHFSKRDNLSSAGMLVTELGDKFMLIQWERFKE